MYYFDYKQKCLISELECFQAYFYYFSLCLSQNFMRDPDSKIPVQKNLDYLFIYHSNFLIKSIEIGHCTMSLDYNSTSFVAFRILGYRKSCHLKYCMLHIKHEWVMMPCSPYTQIDNIPRALIEKRRYSDHRMGIFHHVVFWSWVHSTALSVVRPRMG